MSTTTARIAPSSGFSGQGGVHPARYSPAILVNIREELKRIEGPVLDPFAGTGRIHLLGRDDTVGIEIGPEWAQLHQRTFRGDATELPFSDETFGAVAISPCYGNRMADLYDGRDGSRRHTYRIALGRLPSANSAAALQWGEAYRELHRNAWAEAWRVLRPGGLILVNVADHIRRGERQPVTAFHWETLQKTGFRPLRIKRIPTPGRRQGANRNLRTDGEMLLVLRKPDAAPF